MSTALRQRTLLVRHRSLGETSQIYLCDDAIEVDLLETYDIHTRRIFFADVQMITLSRKRSRIGLFVSVILLLLSLLFMVMLFNEVRGTSRRNLDIMPFLLVSAFLNMPFVAMLGWFYVPYSHVTVFGTNGMTMMSWHFSRSRAKGVFTDLAERIRAQHKAATPALADQSPALSAAPAPDNGPDPTMAPAAEPAR